MKTFNCNGEVFTLAEMIDANSEDEEVIEWLNAAEVGDSFPGITSLTRIQ